MSAALVPPELLDPVLAYFRPQRVILFGSAARGEAGPNSDIDLLVVVDDDTPAEKVTIKAGRESRKPSTLSTTPCRALQAGAPLLGLALGVPFALLFARRVREVAARPAETQTG
jgi:hypothetical protein